MAPVRLRARRSGAAQTRLLRRSHQHLPGTARRLALALAFPLAERFCEEVVLISFGSLVGERLALSCTGVIVWIGVPTR